MNKKVGKTQREWKRMDADDTARETQKRRKGCCAPVTKEDLMLPSSVGGPTSYQEAAIFLHFCPKSSPRSI